MSAQSNFTTSTGKLVNLARLLLFFPKSSRAITPPAAFNATYTWCTLEVFEVAQGAEYACTPATPQPTRAIQAEAEGNYSARFVPDGPGLYRVDLTLGDRPLPTAWVWAYCVEGEYAALTDASAPSSCNACRCVRISCA